MALAPKLFAVVARGGALPAAPVYRRTHDSEAVRSERQAEEKRKRALDRATELLDRLDQRLAEYDGRIKELQRRKQTAVERAERVSDRLIRELESAGLTRADGYRSAVLTCPSPAAVDVFDPALLPERFWRQPKAPAKQPDKAKIKSALESRERVPGARLLQGVTLRRS